MVQLKKIGWILASKYFDYQILATLYERGQIIPNGGDKRGGRKDWWCHQNYDIIKGWFHRGWEAQILTLCGIWLFWFTIPSVW